jgi:hypothetical protein
LSFFSEIAANVTIDGKMKNHIDAPCVIIAAPTAAHITMSTAADVKFMLCMIVLLLSMLLLEAAHALRFLFSGRKSLPRFPLAVNCEPIHGFHGDKPFVTIAPMGDYGNCRAAAIPNGLR